MAISYAARERAYVAAPRRGPVTRLLEDERWLGALLLLPTAVLLALFIAYPFAKGVLLSVTDARVGVPGTFVGLQNFIALAHDGIFREAVWNTFIYTGVTTVFKLALGLWLALLLNRHFRGKALTRAFVLLPFIIPTVLSTFAWKWMFDPTFSVINWTLYRLDIIDSRINWLGDPQLAMISIIIVNVWRGVPFYAISLLAGLQTISPELQEAAAIDGARPWQRFWHVTWPLLLPVTMVVVLFSVIQTFADFPGVRAHRRRTGQCHAPVRHLCLSDRGRDRAVERGRRRLARDVPGTAGRGDRPAALHPPRGDPLSHDRGRKVETLGVFLPSARRFRLHAAVPVLLDAGNDLPAGCRVVSPVDGAELHAVLDRASHFGPHQVPVHRDAVRHLDGQHAVHRARLHRDLAVLRPARGLCAVAPEISVRRQPRHRHLRDLSGAADAAVHPARRHHPQLSSRRHAVGAHPHLSDLPDSVLHLAAHGLFQGDPARTRGMCAHRRRHALESHGLHHLPDRGAGHPFGRDLRFHAVLERIHLCPGVPVVSRAEDGAGRRYLGADPRRRVLLGTADGGRIAGLDPGRDRVLVLRGALCRGADRLGERMKHRDAADSAVNLGASWRA